MFTRRKLFVDIGELTFSSKLYQTKCIRRSLVHGIEFPFLMFISFQFTFKQPLQRGPVLNMYTISILSSVVLCLSPIALSHPLES